jgi:hypothetical protein
MSIYLFYQLEGIPTPCCDRQIFPGTECRVLTAQAKKGGLGLSWSPMKGSSNVIKSVSKGWKFCLFHEQDFGRISSILELAAYCESVFTQNSAWRWKIDVHHISKMNGGIGGITVPSPFILILISRRSADFWRPILKLI